MTSLMEEAVWSGLLKLERGDVIFETSMCLLYHILMYMACFSHL